jgi:hypothetical protein
MEALNTEFANVTLEDDDYSEKLSEYNAKLAGLLRGTKNLIVSYVVGLNFI